MKRTVLVVLALGLSATVAFAQQHGHDAASTAPSGLYDSNKLGHVHRMVSTTNAEAQRLFDQGLALCYAFNHDEAVRSFQRALAADPKLAMAWWGIAYAVGPNINLPIDSLHSAQGYDAAQKAKALESGASDVEKAWIDAIAVRYANPAPADRAPLDKAWHDAMKSVLQRWPDDPDAGVIYAESIMLLSPWNYWDKDGTPHADTPELLATLEHVLTQHPDNIGANHLYIHAVEAAHPERGLAAADRLGALAPDAGHLVHMPTHIWNRVGRYDQSGDRNVKAARIDSAYVTRYHVEGVYPGMYWTHNYDFAGSSYMYAGRYRESIANAKEVTPRAEEMAAMMPMAEFYSARQLVIEAEFHHWKTLVAAKEPPANLPMTRILWDYARGSACAATGHQAEAKAHFDSLEARIAALPKDYPAGLNTGAAVVAIAHHMLAGAISRGAGDLDGAATHLRDAVLAYDALAYDEPEDWLPPPREALGGVLLAKKDFAGAERVFRDELVVHPKSGRALYGLAMALEGEGKMAESKSVRMDLKAAWAHADAPLTPADL